MGVNMTIIAACQMVMALFGGKIFVKFDVKKIMRISSILLAVGYFSYSLATSLPVFYLISVVVGFAMGGTTTMPLSLLIGNWFHQRRGFAVGVAFMGSGIGGMLFSVPIASVLYTLLREYTNKRNERKAKSSSSD